MTADVLTLRPTDTVEQAARALSQRRLGGAPVVDDDGTVLGLLEDDDLIVQDTRLHVPTVISVFGAYLELPSSLRHFESDLRKAVGATVADVMDRDAPTCRPDDTIESVATVLHERNASRMPVVDADGRLVGIISRGDLVRAIVGGDGE
jgi:CBS domain-containing protein